MAQLTTTKEMLVALENIIKNAEKYICIFTFNIKIDKNYMSRLRNAGKRGVKINVVFGVDNGDSKVINDLLEIPGCTVYFKEYLHAKFYYNEKELLIGSMNLSEASAKNNFELGVLFQNQEYTDIINKVKAEAKEIIEDAVLWREINRQQGNRHSQVINNKSREVSKNNNATCIRCGTDVQFDLNKPLCKTCYYAWAEWENEYYLENYCHSCGSQFNSITFSTPECKNCYSKRNLDRSSARI